MILNSDNISKTRNIAEYIQRIHGGEVSASVIAEAFKMHPGHVRGCVNLARCMGIPICSTPNGYYYSIKPEDIRATIKHIEERISKQEQAVCGLREAMGDDTSGDGVTPIQVPLYEFDHICTMAYQCGACREPIDRGDKYCKHCGEAVDWSE